MPAASSIGECGSAFLNQLRKSAQSAASGTKTRMRSKRVRGYSTIDSTCRRRRLIIGGKIDMQSEQSLGQGAPEGQLRVKVIHVKNARLPQVAMTRANGSAVVLPAMPTIGATIPPSPYWRVPITADAAPARER